MSKVPSLNYSEAIKALQRNGWIVVRQKGSHIWLQKITEDKILRITIPETLSHIIKQAQLTLEEFLDFL